MYHVRRTTQLGDPNAWQEIGMVMPTNSMGQFIGPSSVNSFFDVFVDLTPP